MKLYFSGVASPKETEMLINAGVTDWLADIKDFKHLPPGPTHSRVLDSGAYRAWKAKKTINIYDYIALVVSMERRGQCLWAIAPDVIGNPVATRKNWEIIEPLSWYEAEVGQKKARIFPVYQWGGSYKHLEFYARQSPVVCIGGLVPLMREKHQPTLDELKRICRDYQTLHLLGLNWLRAIEDLADYPGSFDSSKWLDGARYRHWCYKNTRNQHLCGTHRNIAAKWQPEVLNMSREELCIAYAKTLKAYLN